MEMQKIEVRELEPIKTSADVSTVVVHAEA